MILVGANPGDRSARVGHYYAGRGNQFWPIMYESGVIPEPLSYEDDRRILEFGIGMTDLVKRPTRGVEEIERQEFAEGRVLLAQKLEDLKPRIVAFNGKMVYEKFTGRPCKLGLQKGKALRRAGFCLAVHQRLERRNGARREDPLFQETRRALERLEGLGRPTRYGNYTAGRRSARNRGARRRGHHHPLESPGQN